MQEYTFHCQLKLNRMDGGQERLKFNAEFFCAPNVNERVMFHKLDHYFLENREEGERLHDYFSPLDFEDPLSVTCKVSQIMYFDHTMMKFHKQNNGVTNGKAIGVLYLDELESEPLCPTGAP